MRQLDVLQVTIRKWDRLLPGTSIYWTHWGEINIINNREGSPQVLRLLYLEPVRPTWNCGASLIVNNMDHPSIYHTRGIRLPNCLAWFFLTGQVGINVLIEMSCWCQLFQMSFQHETILGHMSRVLVKSTIKFLISQGRIFKQFLRPNKERFPLDLFHEFIDRLLEDCLECPKGESFKIRWFGQVFCSVAGSS